MVNSALISVGAATIAVSLGTLAAYGIARFRFERPRNGSPDHLVPFSASLAASDLRHALFPHHAELHLLDTVWGLILLNATFNLTFPMIILTQMFREVPIELEEAAQVDGASTGWHLPADRCATRAPGHRRQLDPLPRL